MRPAYAGWAFGIIAFGIALRCAALLARLPPTNSDEATMGLMARHIVAGTGYPVWFYGQDYMGSIEAWVAAPLFALFGSSTGMLRLPNLLWYTLLLVTVYHLGIRLYSHRVALVATALLALGSDRVFKNQLLSGGGYPEIVPMVAVLFLIAMVAPGSRHRTWLFGLWGVVAGLAIWDHWIALPYVGAAGLLLAWFARRDLLRLPGATLLAGVLVGAAPMLLDNLTGRTNSIEWFVYLNQVGRDKAAGATLADHLQAGFITGVPMGTGLCMPSRCTSAHSWWGVVYPMLLVLAAALAFVALRRRRGHRFSLRHAGRLALAVAGLVTMLSYSRSPAAVLYPIESNRYLALLGVTAPVLVGTLLAVPWRRVFGLAGRAVLAAVFAFAVFATVTAFGAAPEAQFQERNQAELVSALDRLGITSVYSDYWTCHRLVFAVDERIVCATIEEGLRRGHDRYKPYRERAAADPTRAYALLIGRQPERELAAYIAEHRVSVMTLDIGRYRLYVPSNRADLPLPR